MGTKMVMKHYDFKEEDIAGGKYRAWDLIQPLWYSVSIYDGLDIYNKDLTPFTDAQRRLFALYWYDSEVCNGGHGQFFFNSTGIVWKDAIDGMHMIGAKHYAANFQKVIDLFGGSIPFDRSERWDAVDKLSEVEDFDDFEETDNFYYVGEEDIEDLMNEYVRTHAAEFVVNGDYPDCEM